MEEPPVLPDNLKVIYSQNKGKLFKLIGLSYPSLVAKLYDVFKLQPINTSNYYHLFFIDSDKDRISIRSEQDFATFLDICGAGQKKLYLSHTKDESLHFQGRAEKRQQRELSEDEVERIIAEKREEILKKIEKDVGILKEELWKELDLQIQKYDAKIVHKNAKCEKCKNGKFITGTRYECIICDYNICEECERSEDHHHPLFKIRKESQSIRRKSNKMFIEMNAKSYANQRNKEIFRMAEKKKKAVPAFFEEFKTVTDLSKEDALAFIESHPKMGLEELLQAFFSAQ